MSCGTPDMTDRGVDFSPSTKTDCSLKQKQAWIHLQPATKMEWINMRLNFSYVQCTGVDRGEIRTILIGLAWRLHYEHTLSGLNFGLWNPPFYCESRNPQVFFTRVVPLTTIYIFEDINWSAKRKHCKNSLDVSADQSSDCWNTLGRFIWSF